MSDGATPNSQATSGTLRVTVVTPEGAAYEGPAASVVVPSHDGEVAFLKQHAPFVGAVGIGELRVTPPEGEVQRFYLEGGVVQVLDDVVTVLAEAVKPSAELDADEARTELESALAAVPTTDEAFAERDHAVDSARARIKIGK